ncbi:MAG: shikimate dehydrogenase [Anaerolineae bacterium]|nr:shikimate dehydrogenase [Anaerolineae bacterium]
MSVERTPEGRGIGSFACVIHPLNPKQDVARKYPFLARVLPTPLIHFLSRFWPPVYLSRVSGVRSESTGKEASGWLLACPLTAGQMLRLPPATAYRKIVQTGRLAQKLGARILGLLAFTSVIGDGGLTIARRLNMPVTTGRSLTIAVALEELTEAARWQGIRPERATVAVVGATGSIGLACSRLLAPQVGALLMVGREETRLAMAAEMVRAAGAQQVRTTTRIEAIQEADIVLSATNASRPVIQPEHLKQGAVVCDVALPPDVSPRVVEERKDVLVIEGGVMDVPGTVDFGFNFGLPPGKAYACMAETMILALEERFENYSLGKEIETERVREIAQLARVHGFKPTVLNELRELSSGSFLRRENGGR